MNDKVLNLTDENLADTIGTGVTLVDFWAPWCGPCQTQGPIIEKLAEKMSGKAKVTKLNVDEGPQSAAKYGVRSIPTLMIFKDGEVLTQLVGVQSEAELDSVLEQAL